MTGPNLVFIFSDQHAQQVAGCYGDPLVQTPNLDWLAGEGVRFTNAYCPSPICVPSRMSMLTARWPHTQQCWTNDDILRSDLPTWPMAATLAGTRPALVGRMHAVGPDQMHGYCERLVGDHSPSWPGVPRKSMGPLSGTNDPFRASLDVAGAGGNPYQTKDKDVTATAVDWIRTSAPAACAAGQPFCLTVGYMLPHPPYVVDREAFELYHGRVGLPQIAAEETQEHPFHAWWRSNRDIIGVSDDDILRARAAYWGMVHRLDQNIGQILDALRETGNLDNTLIVYASDHGDHLGNRGLWWKHTFYDESAKVPIIMRLPGVVPQGEVRDQVVNLIDLSQTMLEAIGAPQLPNADGRSFWPVVLSDQAEWGNRTFSEYCTDMVPAWTGGRAVRQRMYRDGPWKLVRYDGEPDQLFNLDDDPQELCDRTSDPACAAIKARMAAELSAGWDPDEIRQIMLRQREDKDFVSRWANEARPSDPLIWDLLPEHCWTDPENT